jgi:hypothetical protein
MIRELISDDGLSEEADDLKDLQSLLRIPFPTLFHSVHESTFNETARSITRIYVRMVPRHDFEAYSAIIRSFVKGPQAGELQSKRRRPVRQLYRTFTEY